MALFQSPNIVTDGLAVCLDAANTKSYSGSGTTWTDIGLKGTYATLVNGPTFNTENQGSIVFDGTNDYLQFDQRINSEIIQKDCSFNIWVQFHDDSRDQVIITHPRITGFQPLILWYDKSAFSTPNNSGGSDVGGGSTNVLTVMVTNNSNTEHRWTTANNVFGNNTANTWHNICVVLDTTNNKYYTYLNGQQEALYNASIGGIKTSSNNFHIGFVDSGDAQSWLDGQLSQFSVYRRALTAAEVKQNFDAHKGRYV